MMHVNYNEYSDVGGREKNEDMVLVAVYPGSLIALVADGLGGHGNGDVASRIAVHVINEEVSQGVVSCVTMENAIRRANERILRRQETDGMKTTIAAVWLTDTAAYAAHVGDTRIYQFRDGRIVYQSQDHSISQLAVTMGEISADQIRGHEDRNKLTRALGSREDVRIELNMLDVKTGDAFLLCSDGFWELVWEEEMLEELNAASDAQQWLSGMRKYVEKRLNQDSDNHSAAALMIVR